MDFPRPETKLAGFTDQEWAEVLGDDAKWEAWQKKDNDDYAIFVLAGKAGQIEYAGTAKDEDARFDYSYIKNVLPRCYQRLSELEPEAARLISDHWIAVLAVASELQKRSKLTAAEVEEIIRNVMPEVQFKKSKA